MAQTSILPCVYLDQQPAEHFARFRLLELLSRVLGQVDQERHYFRRNGKTARDTYSQRKCGPSEPMLRIMQIAAALPIMRQKIAGQRQLCLVAI